MKNNFTEDFANWREYYSKKFKDVFGFDMPFDSWGIDFFKLSEIINVEDYKKADDVIVSRYGKDALDLVKEILSNPPLMFKKDLTKE